MLKRFPEPRQGTHGTPSLSESLHFLILSRIHAGRLKPGDRLPSIRDVASRSGADHRVVSHAYRALEDEGLVEVRPKAGVFVASSATASAEGTEARSWAADILFEAWERGISRSALCRMFGGMLSAPVRCGCIESNTDFLVALTGAIEDGLSLEAVPMRVDPAADEATADPEDCADVDVIVTTVFHARYARAVGARLNKPVAILNLRRDFAVAVAKRLATRPTTLVMADPEYARRYIETASAIGDVLPARFVAVEDAEREKLDLSGSDLVITRAARRRLGLEDYHLVPTPMVSADSARELCELIAAATPARRPRLKLDGGDPAPANIRIAPPALGFADRAEIPAQAPAAETIVREVESALNEAGLFEALCVLNRTTSHRFTAIYRFEPGWVRSVVLVDRENPHLRVGADVPMKESYCVLVPDSESYRIENAMEDARLLGHAARAAVLCYGAVHLRDGDGASWGTLCHYDFRPTRIGEEEMRVLEAVRPVIQRVLGPAARYVPLLPDCVAVGAIQTTAR